MCEAKVNRGYCQPLEANGSYICIYIYIYEGTAKVHYHKWGFNIQQDTTSGPFKWADKCT